MLTQRLFWVAIGAESEEFSNWRHDPYEFDLIQATQMTQVHRALTGREADCVWITGAIPSFTHLEVLDLIQSFDFDIPGIFFDRAMTVRTALQLIRAGAYHCASTEASRKLTFNSQGQLTSPASTATPPAIKITSLADGAADMNIGWNLYSSSGTPAITQYDQASGVASTSQNGFPAGQVSGVSIQNGGLVVATLPNGQQATIAQLAVAAIANPQSLVSVRNNELSASVTTAAPAIGTANSSGRGQIMGEALEQSNVDMASEFTSLLTDQLSYQATSRVITTSEELLQETVNLIHS